MNQSHSQTFDDMVLLISPHGKSVPAQTAHLRVCRRLQNACDETERSLIHDKLRKRGLEMVFICLHLEGEKSSC